MNRIMPIILEMMAKMFMKDTPPHGEDVARHVAEPLEPHPQDKDGVPQD